MQTPTPRGTAAPPAWHGELTLRFHAIGGRTAVASRRHAGPFCIQRPFHPGDGACHVYLLHPPGGLAGGDRLVLDAAVEPGAAVLLTTPAATKFYRSDAHAAVQLQSLTVGANASLEWLPLDTILFGGSRAQIASDIALDSDARFIGWEMTSLGRPLSGDSYASGGFEQRTRIAIGGTPQLHERFAADAGDELLRAPFGLGGATVWGTLHAYPACARALAAARDTCAAAPPTSRCAATLLDRLLVVRWLGAEPEALRELFAALWRVLRASVVGLAPEAPRIWKT